METDTFTWELRLPDGSSRRVDLTPVGDGNDHYRIEAAAAPVSAPLPFALP